mgnify:FL=1
MLRLYQFKDYLYYLNDNTGLDVLGKGSLSGILAGDDGLYICVEYSLVCREVTECNTEAMSISPGGCCFVYILYKIATALL